MTKILVKLGFSEKAVKAHPLLACLWALRTLLAAKHKSTGYNSSFSGVFWCQKRADGSAWVVHVSQFRDFSNESEGRVQQATQNAKSRLPFSILEHATMRTIETRLRCGLLSLLWRESRILYDIVARTTYSNSTPTSPYCT
jgi:hypothetical protein